MNNNSRNFVYNKFLKNLYLVDINLNIQSFTVGVSGGQDSLVLLLLFTNFRSIHNNQLHLVNCNHGWRSNSISNSLRIFYLSKYTGATFNYFSHYSQLSNEKNARLWRYGRLLHLSNTLKYNGLVLGHTFTDKVETILYSFFRNNLDSISYNIILPYISLTNYLVLIRPLLTIKRSQTYWLCQLTYLPLWSDNTNYQFGISRNRIRNELIPYIKNIFNPNIEYQIDKFFYNLKMQKLYDDNKIINLLYKLVKKSHKIINLNIDLIKILSILDQYKLLKNFFMYFYKDIPTSKYIKHLIVLISKSKINAIKIIDENVYYL
uniref:tRNA(Ile)-lysidine synthase n=1 Tax=Cyanidium sp. THAL103 TaxID=3027999 RepID=A0A9Y1I499_9RHOD|nr:tRNA(Ile)-lysidine synthetase [Cyanidium sp. THAL103]